MLNFVQLDACVWKRLSLHSSQAISIYFALYFKSNVYTCNSHRTTIKQLAEDASIKDISAVYKELRKLTKTRMLRKIASPRGILQYKFLLHTPKQKKGELL